MKNYTTPIFLISAIIIVITIPIALYYFTIGSGGGMGLAGMIALIIGIVSFVILYIEQLILKEFKPKRLVIWLTELPLIIGSIFIYLFSEKEVIYKVDDSLDWFVIVLDEEKYEIPEHTFPFNLTYNIGNQQVHFINSSNHKNYHKSHVSWSNGYGDSSYGNDVLIDGKLYRFSIFYNPKINPNNKKVEMIKNQVINEIKKKNCS